MHSGLKGYSNALGGEVSYYHDRHGLEVDCVLRLGDGRYVLFEFKLGSRQIEEGAIKSRRPAAQNQRVASKQNLAEKSVPQKSGI